MSVRDLCEQLQDNISETDLLVDPTMPEFMVWLETDTRKLPKLRSDWTKLA